jgi:hypothetical protein
MILRVAVLTALVAFSIPAVAAGQQPSDDSLLRRIDLLERRSSDLEQRVRELEAVIKGEPSRDLPVPTSAKWRDLQNWRRLRRGMNMNEVRALLGEPERVQTMTFGTWWYFGNPIAAKVELDDRSKLQGWSEP